MMNLLNQNELQQLIQVTVYEAVTTVLTTHNQSSNSSDLSDSSELSELSEQNGIDAEENEDSNHEFQSRNIRFLNSNSELDLVKVKDNKQLYHNIFSFTNQVQVMTFTRNSTTLQQNLQFYLLEKTDHWYIKKLNYLSQLDLQNINDVKEWCKTLKSHFQDLSSWALALLEDIHYTVQDVWCCCDSVDYIQFIVLHDQNSDMIITDTTQVRLVYKHMNDELCCDLPQSNNQFTVTELIEILNEQKNIWFDIYAHNSATLLNRLTQQQLQSYGRNHSFQLFNIRFSEINESSPLFYFNQFSYVFYGNQFSNNYEQWNNHQQYYQNHNNVNKLCWYSSQLSASCSSL